MEILTLSTFWTHISALERRFLSLLPSISSWLATSLPSLVQPTIGKEEEEEDGIWLARRGLVVLVEAGLGIVLRRRCPCSCLHLADLDEAGQPRVQRRLREFSPRQTWLSESPPRLATYCVWWQTKFLLAGNRTCNFMNSFRAEMR